MTIKNKIWGCRIQSFRNQSWSDDFWRWFYFSWNDSCVWQGPISSWKCKILILFVFFWLRKFLI